MNRVISLRLLLMLSVISALFIAPGPRRGMFEEDTQEHFPSVPSPPGLWYLPTVSGMFLLSKHPPFLLEASLSPFFLCSVHRETLALI